MKVDIIFFSVFLLQLINFIREGPLDGFQFFFKKEMGSVLPTKRTSPEISLLSLGSNDPKKPSGKFHEKLKIDSLDIDKSDRKLFAFFNDELVKVYTVALGVNSVGPKQFEGDGKTPEGLYFIDGKNPNSDYHKNLGISYPDEADKAWAREFGRSPGGEIKIHGYPNGYSNRQIRHLASDWTIGCIAVTNSQIDELYEAVEIGSPIFIHP